MVPRLLAKVGGISPCLGGRGIIGRWLLMGVTATGAVAGNVRH